MPRTKFKNKTTVRGGQVNEPRLSSANAFDEVGVAGVKITSGYVHEEYLPALMGARGKRTYRQMRDNDSTIGAILFAIEMLLRAVTWNVEAAKDKQGDTQAEEMVDFVKGVLFEDMSHTWDDFISDIISMLVYGYQLSEIVFKHRVGPYESDPSKRSKYTDGLIGIRKLADRSQETVDKWEMDETGQLIGFWQMHPNGGHADTFIPIDKCLHFRPHQHKGSPEGRSVLRNAYRSWYFLKNIQEIEAIAIERELNGLPVVYIPQEILSGTSSSAKAAKSQYESLVRDIKFNEQGGVVLPSNPYYDADGKPMPMRQVELTLLSTNGTRAIDPGKAITRYQQDIARCVLADFVMLGSNTQQRAGSYSLSSNKTEIFARALDGWNSSIAEVINKKLLSKVWLLNGFDYDYMPRVVPGKVDPEDLGALSEYVQRLSQAGAPLFPDDELENDLRSRAGLPERSMESGDIPVLQEYDEAGGPIPNNKKVIEEDE